MEKKFGIARTLSLIVLVLTTMVSCSLFGPRTGELQGFEIYFSTDASCFKTFSPFRGTASARSKAVHFPNNGALGFTKFWFPLQSTYDILTEQGSLDNGAMTLETQDIEGLSYYKAIDQDNDEPLVLDAASGTPYSPDTDIPYGTTFKGLLIEYVFLEIEMDDYKLRYYTQDSGEFKAGDVLIDLYADSDGWRYLYNKRVFTFDYNYRDHQFPNNTYERIENIRCDIGLFLTDERRPAGMYYENWKYQGGITNETPGYIEDFLRINDSQRLSDYESDSSVNHQDQTLVQIFRPTSDVPMNSGGFIAEKGEDTYLRNVNDGHRPSGKPTLIVNYGPNTTLENPYTVETFPEDANMAKMYKLELIYSLGSPDHGSDGLSIQVPVDEWNEADTPTQAWIELEAFQNFLNIGPSCGGIGARFGWLDFNDEWQGEFSPDAGT